MITQRLGFSKILLSLLFANAKYLIITVRELWAVVVDSQIV